MRRVVDITHGIAPQQIARCALLLAGDHVEPDLAARRYSAVIGRTFADVRPGEMLVYEDSSRGVALAVNRGSAARLLAAVVGQEVTLAGEQP